MNTSEIINEIDKLSLSKKMLVIEKAIQSIRKGEELAKMEKAVNALILDYETDYELTAFTNIDFDNFYEAK